MRVLRLLAGARHVVFYGNNYGCHCRLDTGFLERLNTLLANGEVPGLFEGDELTTLMNQVKENAQRQGHMLDSQDELYKYFTMEVCVCVCCLARACSGAVVTPRRDLVCR